MKRSNNNAPSCKKVMFQNNSVGKLQIPYITNQFGKHYIGCEKFSDHKILENKQITKSISQNNSNSALSNRSILGVTRCSSPQLSCNGYPLKGNTTVYMNFQRPSLIVHRRVQSMNNDVIQKFSVQIKKC
ncbi:unnamed protein product [Blepharisma stoltei]|uniref:Uncharacterized protein n=1 Tax=Blepharisma stoltei TaxID=1481888 RepID=A0AAU9JKC2_9CILI|nr:unnamed protein product [Blepharisma stoltei]